MLVVKNPPAMQETQVRSQEDPLEREMATHCDILAWRISWTEEPGRLQSTRSKESDVTESTWHVREARIYSLINKWCWENWTATCKRIKLNHFLKPYTKINSKWIRDLNARPKTIKFLEENIGSILFNNSLSNIFLDLSPQTRNTKVKISKWDYFK